MWFFSIYLAGCVVYGAAVCTMGLLDKDIPRDFLEKALWTIPMWTVILALTIKNLWRMNK